MTASAARILSEPVTRGYYVRSATVGDPMRVLFAQYAAEDDKCEEELRGMDLTGSIRNYTMFMLLSDK
jgi:hypothetical protein